MGRPPKGVTDTELAILDVLWRDGPQRIRAITDQLYPGGGASRYATVQSLLERLESKEWVRRDRSGFAHVFAAAVERSEFLGRQLQDVADKVCEGSLAPLLLTLAEKAHLTDDERADLMRLIERS